MQPYFFPYIGYFQLIHTVDRFILYENVNYIHKEWMNRNRILIIGKGDNYFNIPISPKSVNKRIYEIEIDNSDKKWRQRILMTLRHNYLKSRYFSEVYDMVEDLICYETCSLHHFNSNSIKGVARFLDIDTEIIDENSRYLPMEVKLAERYPSKDVRIIENGNSIDKKTERVIAICEKENSDIYINPIGGLNLYDKKIFKDKGISLFFLKTAEISYHQFSEYFYPNLSIVDVLFCNGKEGTRSLLNKYEMV